MRIEIITNRSGVYGGLKRLYIIAGFFKEAGHEVVINIDDKSRNTWFKHSIQENHNIIPDIRIIPEVLQRPHPTAKNILYYQHLFDPAESAYDGIVTSSSYLCNDLEEQGFKPEVIPYSFDSNIFFEDPSKKVKGRVLYMPRKNANEASLVKNLSSDIKGLEFYAIDGKSEAETAEILRTGDFFLALSTTEGFGMPPFEAALCGNLVVGYDGRGGADWLREDTFVRCMDPADAVTKLKIALTGAFEDKRRKLIDVIKTQLSVEKERLSWLTFINKVYHARKANDIP